MRTYLSFASPGLKNLRTIVRLAIRSGGCGQERNSIAYLQKSGEVRKDGETVHQICQVFLKSPARADVDTTLEDRHHTVPVLFQELTSLEDRLFILTTSRDDGSIDHTEYREYELVVLLKGVLLVKLCLSSVSQEQYMSTWNNT